MFLEIIYRVLFCVGWSALVVAAQKVAVQYGYTLAIPATGHALTGTALGLLLVFRTNAAYDRFWEGRKLWGSIVNDCRNLARTGSIHLAGDPGLASSVLRWTIAFPWSVMHQLRGGTGLGPIAQELPADETSAVLAANHGPLAVACRISGLFAEARRSEIISDYVQVSLDQIVRSLMDSVGGCERIRNTPLPFVYVVHLRRALIAFCFTLPFVLLADFGWETVPATLLIAYALYGIEEIGVEIEQPFGTHLTDLPLEQFCGVIEENVRGVMRMDVDGRGGSR